MRNIYLFLFALMITVSLASSCTVMARIPVNPDYTSHFQNQTKSDVIKQLGVPDNEVTDGGSGVIYEYVDRAKLQSNTGYFKQIQSSNNVKISDIRRIAFFFDKEDRCYLVKTDATDIQRKHSPGRTGALVGGLLGGLGLVALMVALVASGY